MVYSLVNNNLQVKLSNNGDGTWTQVIKLKKAHLELMEVMDDNN